jgi:CheY-like chemotaxis protein
MTSILVVEDEHLMALAVSEALSGAGYCVETAYSAVDAYAKLEPGPRSFSAVVTDVNLGEGDDGFAVAAQARAMNPAIQVAYMTGNPANLAHFEPDRALMFPKPFDPVDLVQQITMLVPM